MTCLRQHEATKTAEFSQGRQVERGKRLFTFTAEGQGRIQLLAWKKTHNPEVSSQPSFAQSGSHERPPLGPGPSRGALAKRLLPVLQRVLRPCHPSRDIGHICPTAGAKATPSLLGNQKEVRIRVQRTRRGTGSSWEGPPPVAVSWTAALGRLTEALLHALLLGAIVVLIAPASSVDEVITRVLLGIKVPAWEGCAARPSDGLGNAVFWERDSPRGTN